MTVRKILMLAAATFCLGSVAHADTFTAVDARADLPYTDIVDWSQLGPAGTVVTTPATVTTFGGNTITVGNIDGSPFQRLDQGDGWNGSFFAGETVIWNMASSSPFLFLGMGAGVEGVGFNIDA